MASARTLDSGGVMRRRRGLAGIREGNLQCTYITYKLYRCCHLNICYTAADDLGPRLRSNFKIPSIKSEIILSPAIPPSLQRPLSASLFSSFSFFPGLSSFCSFIAAVEDTTRNMCAISKWVLHLQDSFGIFKETTEDGYNFCYPKFCW